MMKNDDKKSRIYVLIQSFKKKLSFLSDFGAGIGRVTKHFLLTQFDVVDIVEQCENFTNNVHVYLVCWGLKILAVHSHVNSWIYFFWISSLVLS